MENDNRRNLPPEQRATEPVTSEPFETPATVATPERAREPETVREPAPQRPVPRPQTTTPRPQGTRPAQRPQGTSQRPQGTQPRTSGGDAQLHSSSSSHHHSSSSGGGNSSVVLIALVVVLVVLLGVFGWMLYRRLTTNTEPTDQAMTQIYDDDPNDNIPAIALQEGFVIAQTYNGGWVQYMPISELVDYYPERYGGTPKQTETPVATEAPAQGPFIYDDDPTDAIPALSIQDGYVIVQDPASGGWMNYMSVYELVGYYPEIYGGTPRPTEEPVPTATPGPSYQLAYVNTTGVRVRASASTSGSVVAQPSQNDIVVILESADGWYRVVADGRLGYVRSDLVTVTTLEALPTQRPASSGSSSGSSSGTTTRTSSPTINPNITPEPPDWFTPAPSNTPVPTPTTPSLNDLPPIPSTDPYTYQTPTPNSNGVLPDNGGYVNESPGDQHAGYVS